MTTPRARTKKKNSIPFITSVLVVDDDPSILKTVQHLLQKCGYQDVRTTSNGKDALKILQDSDVTDLTWVLLIDIHMPGMSGPELVQEIRREPKYHHIPILMISGTDELSLVYHCLKSGADYFLLKPIREESLRNLWQIVFRKRKESSVLQQLDHHKNHTTQLREEKSNLERQIAHLRDEIDSSVRVISREAQSSFQRGDAKPEEVLSTLLQQLRKIDVYKNAFKKVLAESVDIDPTTKRWLEELVGSDPSNQISNLNPISKKNVYRSDSRSIQLLQSWDFNAFDYSQEDLLNFLEDIFDHFGLIEKLQIPREKLQNLFRDIADHYNENPYHNFTHAFDVTQTTFFFLTTAKAAQKLTYLEIFSLLTACVVHDLDHPGLNNQFQVATSSDLALRYNDRSVLENYHCSLAFSLLNKPDNNICEFFTPQEKKESRKLIVLAVLATDLAHHVDITAKWNDIVDRFSEEEKDHQALLIQMLIKASDIGNPMKPFDLALRWAQLIQEEFFSQGDQEKIHGLPISPHMDRENPNLPLLQLNFINYLVKPLFQTLGKLLTHLDSISHYLEENQKRWIALQKANKLNVDLKPSNSKEESPGDESL